MYKMQKMCKICVILRKKKHVKKTAIFLALVLVIFTSPWQGSKKNYVKNLV